MLAAPCRQLLVLDAYHGFGHVALGVVPQRIDRQRLHVDALLVHFRDAPRADLADAGTTLLLDSLAEQVKRLLDHAMRVHIDGLHALAADHDLAAAAATRTRGGIGHAAAREQNAIVAAVLRVACSHRLPH